MRWIWIGMAFWIYKYIFIDSLLNINSNCPPYFIWLKYVTNLHIIDIVCKTLFTNNNFVLNILFLWKMTKVLLWCINLYRFWIPWQKFVSMSTCIIFLQNLYWFGITVCYSIIDFHILANFLGVCKTYTLWGYL